MSRANNEEIFAVLGEIFSETFPDITIYLRPDTIAADVPGWDSLAHVGLIFTIEERFDFQFSIDEITAFNNIRGLVALIEEKTGNK